MGLQQRGESLAFDDWVADLHGILLNLLRSSKKVHPSLRNSGWAAVGSESTMRCIKAASWVNVEASGSGAAGPSAWIISDGFDQVGSPAVQQLNHTLDSAGPPRPMAASHPSMRGAPARPGQR